MTTYAVMTGTSYLHEMLFEPLRRVVKLGDIDDIDLVALKHDPKKTAPLRTMELCMDWVFDALDGSLDKVPVYASFALILFSVTHINSRHLRIICNMIKVAVAKKYKNAELVALGGFFFLRFVGPPITEPSFFGIIKG